MMISSHGLNLCFEPINMVLDLILYKFNIKVYSNELPKTLDTSNYKELQGPYRREKKIITTPWTAAYKPPLPI